MHTKPFKGDFFEIGHQQGRLYRTNGMDFSDVRINTALYKRQLGVYTKYYPEFLEELRGIAVGGAFDEKKVVYDFITGEILSYRRRFGLDKACTIFGYQHENQLFVGRNYDWHPLTEKVFGVYNVVNSTRNSFVGVTDMGIGGPATAKKKYCYYNADDAINDKGLYIGLTFAYADTWSYGLSCVSMIKLIAETCGTVHSALKVFKKVPLCCPKNFFIADKDGVMAVVEHTSKTFKVLYPKNDVLIQTNHYADQTLAKQDTVLKHVPTHDSFIRYYETLRKINLEKRTFKSSSVTKILRNRASYTYQHSAQQKTIWTLSLEMTRPQYTLYWNDVVTGTQCSKKIRP